jgi:diphosphomevalonate decarboxylase
MLVAYAVAHSNIALAKYWGKSNDELNLPAVPSISMTLEALRTETSVFFDPALPDDVVNLDGRNVDGTPRNRVVALLNRVRRMSGSHTKAQVTSRNHFPTAAGLASSASGFAALALAATRAAGIELSPPEVSALARQSSASAARSLWGGYVKLEANAYSAYPIAPGEHFPLCMVIAVTTAGPKPVASTDGMQSTRSTSPYYSAWLDAAPALYDTALRAVLEADLASLGAALERSALLMHASMLAGDPALMYFEPGTIAVIHAVHQLRRGGISAYFTMDAGPHVKVVTQPQDADAVAIFLRGIPGVRQVIVSKIGPDATVSVTAPNA